MLNEVNLGCLAAAGAGRLQGVFAGILRAVDAATARASGRGPQSAQAKPRKTYLRCADMLRFLAAACRDETVQGSLTRNLSNLGALLAIVRAGRYPLVTVEAVRVLRPIFLAGPAPSK